jgi:hypothetical protein
MTKAPRTPVLPARDRPGAVQAPPLPPSPFLARMAAVVTLVNVPIHLVWALGGTWLLPGGDDVAALPQIRLANGVVCVVLVLGAAALLLLGGPWSRPASGSTALHGGGRVLPGLLLTAIGAGAAVCLSHAIYGFVSKALFLAGYDVVRFPDLGDGWSAAQQHTAAVLDVALFEPWFLLEGVALALAGWQYLRTARGRRRWVVAMSGATAVLVVFGVLLAVTGSRVAIG